MKRKPQAHEFDPLIYPRKIWIGIGSSDFDDILDVEYPFPDSAVACVSPARKREDGTLGYLLRFEKKSYMTARNIAHESVHIALDICKECGIAPCVDNQEPLAYLVGYVAKCCNDVKVWEKRK